MACLVHHLVLLALPLDNNASECVHADSPTALGVAHGTDAHCRAVCGAVPSCNAFYRRHGEQSQCILDSRCRATAGSEGCSLGVFTAVGSVCRPPVTWLRLPFRSRTEGEHLSIVFEKSPRACRRTCLLTRECRGFAQRQHGGGRTECHLKAGCATPADVEAAKAGGAALTPRQRKSKFRSQFMTPCGEERSGLRRSLVRGRSGLFHVDCPLTANGSMSNLTSEECRKEEKAGSMLAWSHAHVRVTELVWPRHYSPPTSPTICAGCAGGQTRAALEQRGGTAGGLTGGRGAGGRLMRFWRFSNHDFELAPPAGAMLPPRVARNRRGGDRMFEHVASRVAARSFNGREIILLCTDESALPLTLNLVANFASLALHHALLLGTDQRVCTRLTRQSAPVCGWSSLLRQHKKRLKGYGVGPLQLIWLQRWQYVERALRLGLNALMLDADIVLFADPYPYFKGVFSNYTLISLRDSSAGEMRSMANGGTWYFQRLLRLGGPVLESIFRAFRRRTVSLLNVSTSAPFIRYDETFAGRRGQPADRMLDDQYVINNVLTSAYLRRDIVLGSHAALNGKSIDSNLKATDLKHTPDIWTVSPRASPTPASVGHYPPRWPATYQLRTAALVLGGVTERMMQAPSWLFGGESDNDGRLKSGRPAVSHFGARLPPCVLTHFVCVAWPGMGGRLSGMELWGRWYAADQHEQLRDSADVEPTKQRSRDGSKQLGTRSADGDRAGGGGGSRRLGFDAYGWIRTCGIACGLLGCTPAYERRKDDPKLATCSRWLAKTTPLATPMLAAPRKGLTGEALIGFLRDEMRRAVLERTADAPALHSAAQAAFASASTHAEGLVAFLYPLQAASRAEYQLYVHVLHSAAMLTGRRPVLPLAHCNAFGQWAESSRCIFVMRSDEPVGGRFCAMRPPSGCHDRIALPNAIAHVPPAERAAVRLPRLPLIDGNVDAAGLAAALSAGELRGKRLLLLDPSGLTEAEDDLSRLTVTVKGWLCTLEHKSCQNTC